ncbi:glycosyltransferase family A protein [Gemmatimonas sp.]|uniref:glycosyltransferase family 2 protein n=1 Tax=Gemmatimonas sp. TaxID=1962908 RepID=UPI00286C8C69|nr:glycosyltransferase family A protein [Gemmatimonas sp.]
MTSPRFSVIIPTRARLPQLRRCLTALAAQTLARDDFEVVIVNDGSPPLPNDEIEAFRQRLTIRSIRQEWGGPAAARNTGIREAQGECLAFTDDDCAPAPTWLATIDAALRATPNALVGGHVRNALDDNVFSEASQLLIDFLYDRFDSAATRGPRFFTSNNFAGATASFRAIGGFDTTFRLPAGEDRDLTDRWQAAGWPHVYAREALVQHHHVMSFRSYTRQHLNYGRGAWTFHQARAKRQTGVRETESPGFYAALLGYPLQRGRTRRPVVQVALLAWSQGVNALGYFLEKARSRA